MRRTEELARELMRQAHKNFVEDGALRPVVTLITTGGDQISCLLNTEHYPADALGSVVGAVGGLAPWRYISFVVEAWSQESKSEDLDQDNLPARGYLQGLAESGDESVRTVILTHVFDPHDWDETFLLSDLVEPGDPPTFTEKFGGHGLAPGFICENTKAAWEWAQEHPPPPEIKESVENAGLSLLVMLLVAIGAITDGAAMLVKDQVD